MQSYYKFSFSCNEDKCFACDNLCMLILVWSYDARTNSLPNLGSEFLLCLSEIA